MASAFLPRPPAPSSLSHPCCQFLHFQGHGTAARASLSQLLHPAPVFPLPFGLRVLEALRGPPPPLSCSCSVCGSFLRVLYRQTWFSESTHTARRLSRRLVDASSSAPSSPSAALEPCSVRGEAHVQGSSQDTGSPSPHGADLWQLSLLPLSAWPSHQQRCFREEHG